MKTGRRNYTQRYIVTDFCIKMGSDQSRFSGPLTARNKVTRLTVSTDKNFLRRTETEWNRGPAYQPNALPLGQTGPRPSSTLFFSFKFAVAGPVKAAAVRKLTEQVLQLTWHEVQHQRRCQHYSRYLCQISEVQSSTVFQYWF